VTLAVASTLLISAAGALAIYAVHRSMPAVPPGFERVARPAQAPKPPESGDDARFRHLRRPEPGVNILAAQPPRLAAQPDARPDAAASVAAVPRSSQSPAPPAQAQPGAAAAASARPQPPARTGERLAPLQAAQCGDESLLARVVCNERVRLRFCRGRWNDHPDCEAAKPPNQVN